MASLLSWSGGLKKKENDVLNSLSNLNVRTNNATTKQSGGLVDRIKNAVTATAQAHNVPITSKPSSSATLNTLSNLNVRSNNIAVQPIQNSVKKLNNFNSGLSKINQANGGVTEKSGRMSFGDFKSTMSAKNIIDHGGNGAPLKATAIKNARDINLANKSYDATGAKSNSIFRGLNTYSKDTGSDTGWKKYYNQEFKKEAGSQNFGQRLLDQGSVSRRAEVNARNKYAQDLYNASHDRNGNVTDSELAKRANEYAKYNTTVANNANQMGQALSRKIGASYDSDYYTGFDWNLNKNKASGNPLELLGKQLYATANAVRNMSVGDAVLGADDTQKFDGRDVAKFAVDLVPGMLTAPIQGGTNVIEAIRGQGTDSETGRHRELTGLERAGRGLSGAIDAAGVFFGGSGELLSAGANALFKKGAAEATKQVLKQTSKQVLKDYLRAILEEGTEEGVQQAFEFFGNGGKLITKDGDFDNESFKQLLSESAQAAALGAVGGAMFKGGADVINSARNKLGRSNIGSNLNNNLISQNAKPAEELEPPASQTQAITENLTQNTQFNQDGNAYKTNENGTATRLSDEELVQVANTQSQALGDQTTTVQPTQNTTTLQSQSSISSINPIRDNSVSSTTIAQTQLNDLLARAAAGDTDAARLLEQYGYNQNSENTGWQTKGVDEVINPEQNTTTKDLAQRKQERLNQAEDLIKRAQESAVGADPNAAQSLRNQEQFINPSTQNYDTSRTGTNETTDVARLQNALQELGINPAGMSTSDMLNTYIEATNRTQTAPDTQITAENGMRDTEPIITPKDTTKAQEAVVDTRTGNNLETEGSVNETTRVANINTELSNKIDEVLGNRNYRQPVMLRESTPDVLVKLGIKNLPMYENPAHIRNNILTESEAKNAGIFRDGDHYHGLGKDTFMEAINALDVPRAVFKNNDLDNNYFILTAVKDGNGNTVVVPIEVETTTVANYMKIDTNRVKTLFGYDDNVGLNRYIKDNIKSNKFTKIDRGAGLITPAAGSDDSVSQNGSNVNANNPIYQYYQKFGEDFYEKMPDNLKEKYEEMLDMQPRDGNGRYTDPITGRQIIDLEAGNGRSYDTEETLPDNFDVKHYISDQVEAQKARSRVPLRERIADATAELKHYLIDDAVAYERYIKDKNERLNIREGVDRVRSSDMIASQWMKDHGLEEIGKMSNEDLNEFQQYLIAKRALEVAEQGKATGRSIKITLVAMSDDIIYESKQRIFYGTNYLPKLCNATNFRRYVFH